MSSTSSSSDSEGSVPEISTIEVYLVAARIEKLESEKKKKMLAIGGGLKQNMDRVLQMEKHIGFPVPKGKTGPENLEIPDYWKQLNGHPFVFFNSGKGKDWVIGKESHYRIVRLSHGIGLVETSTAAQKKIVEGIKEVLAAFNAQEMSNSMARMANAIDGIELDDLNLDGV